MCFLQEKLHPLPNFRKILLQLLPRQSLAYQEANRNTMKSTKVPTKTGWEIRKELEELEPKSIEDYILKGSALTQLLKKYETNS